MVSSLLYLLAMLYLSKLANASVTLDSLRCSTERLNVSGAKALYSVGTRFENLLSPFTNQQSALIPWCGVKAKGEFLSCLAKKLSLFSLEKDSPAARFYT